MTDSAALLQFFSGFGLPAYPDTSVPAKAELPYLTYENTMTTLYEGAVDIAVNLWFRTDSEAVPNAKVREISEAIGRKGRVIEYDNGRIWINRGEPWSQSLTDKEDPSIKRRYMIFKVTYLNPEY